MIAKHKFWRVLTRVHKWAGLVLGIQIILWFASGLFMSFFHIDKVHGDNMAEKRTWPLQIEEAAPLSDVQGLYIRTQEDIHCSPMQRNACIISKPNNIKLVSAVGTPVWEFDNGRDKIYFSGSPASVWLGLSEGRIRAAARSYYKADASIEKAVLITEIAPKDFSKALPIWQVTFDDKSNTRLYMSPMTGELVNVRTRLWRVFDFMWMLHIMGYPDRTDFNTLWLVLASFGALLFALSGMGLVVHRVFLRPRPKKKT